MINNLGYQKSGKLIFRDSAFLKKFRLLRCQNFFSLTRKDIAGKKGNLLTSDINLI